MTAQILVVEDDTTVSALIAEYLSDNDMHVRVAASGDAMRALLHTHEFDLIILDVRLPDADGFDLARELRGTSNLPIIMLTGRADEIDRVVGLETGADDYITKPFSPRELLARIRAVLRRYEIVQPPQPGEVRRDHELRTYRFAGWTLSTGLRKLVNQEGQRIDLTNGEYALLMVFLRSPKRVLSRDQLLESSRLHDDIYDRTIDVQIMRLRRKIEGEPNQRKLIRTERGTGYIFDCDVTSQ